MSKHCSAPFPCLTNIWVCAGFDAPCAVCEPHLEELRKIEGWVKVGDFYTSSRIALFQQKWIAAEIEERQVARVSGSEPAEKGEQNV